MKTTRYQSDDERSVLTGMIVSTRVLAKLHAHLKGEKKGPFRSKWSNLICRWCLEHYGKYQQAPKHAIETLFRDYAETSTDEDTVALIEKYLSTLSDEYKRLAKELNEDFVIDQAARHFNQVRLERLCQQVEADLLKRDVKEAHKRVLSFNPVSIESAAMVDVLTDKNVIRDTISAEENETLIHYPGPLGEFFGNQFQRDGLVAFLAPEKRGKSFWLIDVAWRASVRNRRKTVFYSVGDMSQRQMMRRIISRAAGRPFRAGSVAKPIEVRNGGKVRYETLTFKERITVAEAQKAMHRMHQKTAHSKSLLKMRCTPNASTQIAHIEADLEQLERAEGWVADVVVIDYADILLPEPGCTGMDTRHQINETWKAMRRLSQKRHCLVVTATQSDAESYDATTLRRGNFSEDKRKIAHVTGMAGINQTEEEKERGIYRLNWIVVREGVYFESKCVTVVGSLELANPAMTSCW